MPLPVPAADNRTFAALVDEMVARIPAHTPEWTNFGPSDPGYTLVQLFAHVTESLIYRTNRIPDRNRAKFLQMLGVPLLPAQDASGFVSFVNERAPEGTQIIARQTELFAGKIPFRTMTSVDVLPLTARLYLRRAIVPTPDQIDYYRLLYASYGRQDQDPGDFNFYETIDVTGAASIDLSTGVDHSLWIALIGRDDLKDLTGPDPWASLKKAIENRTLSLGIVPDRTDEARKATPSPAVAASDGLLRFELPNIAEPVDFSGTSPAPGYRRLAARANFDPLTAPGIVELTLPAADLIGTWTALDPLEAGVGDLPPALDPPELAATVVTWLRVRSGGTTDLRLRWAGINAAQVRQQRWIANERLEDGDGTPDQSRTLRQTPVLDGSVSVLGIDGNGRTDFTLIDDVRAAAPELPVAGAPDMRDPRDVFSLDAEAGLIRFGDGLTGRRPRDGEALYASYASCAGAEGNVPAGAIKAAPDLADGLSVTNPLPTTGGADPESIAAAERQVPRFITHRDRLVTAEDFAAIAQRTPGVALGRVEVLPAAHPDIAPVTAGTAPGAVTLMVVPRSDPAHPDAPRAQPGLLDALCAHLEPRRLVTTELVIDGPHYVGLWVSIGIEVAGGYGAAQVADAVAARIRAYLSPLPRDGGEAPPLPPVLGAPVDPALRGWPLGQAVHARALMAEAARAAGVTEVADILLALGNGTSQDSIPISGLELPEILGISVVAGAPVPLDQLRGAGTPAATGTPRLPVPVLAETC